MTVYTTDDGTAISTHSMLKTFRRCPQQTMYKYIDRLSPKVVRKPLKRGSWVHKLLETHYLGHDWREVHRKLSENFYELFDEEREELGDLPREIARLMRSYLWHYKHDHWRIHEVEFILETTFPDGTIYRCKIDLLVEDQFGLWLVDHKTHARLPDLTFRLLDAQSALYLWCALRNNIPVQGFIWNYIRTKPPTIPQMTQKGRLSRRRIDTDYPTFLSAIKKSGLELDASFRGDITIRDMLKSLAAQQFKPGEPQTSSFFRRDVLEKSPEMLKKVALENYHTSKRMHNYNFKNRDAVERSISRSCTYDCSFVDLCSLELFGGNPKPLVRQRYEVTDPLSYYEEEEHDERV